jgi:hypothetical protein
MTCEFKEYLSINSKGPHCGSLSKARVVFLDNCSIKNVPVASIAMTTYFPGLGCWNDLEINNLDKFGFEQIEVGTKIDLIVGVWGGMGKGTGVSVARDIHEISVSAKNFCPTNHSMVPHVLMTADPSLAWLRESF